MARYPLQADTILGHDADQYRIDTVLGPGGFGITYLARSLRLDRDVAIKEYFPAEYAFREGTATIRSSTNSGGGRDDFFTQGKKYFIDEARVLGKFRHDHIVRVIDLIEQNNTAYMVLEFEEGRSFKHWLREIGRQPTQAELDDIVEPLLSALEAIHTKGIFHRDIAPDNIIIRPNGDPVLIDFGAARLFVRDNSHTLGAIVKHGYSPPEQYTLDTKLQGAWSDIYALCATLYHAIMGHPPEEASKRQLQDSVMPIAEHMDPFKRSLYRPGFIAGIEAGLTLRPKDRPGSAQALRALLNEGRETAEADSSSHHAFAGHVDEPPATAVEPRRAQPKPAATATDQTQGTVLQRRTGPPSTSAPFEQPHAAEPAPPPGAAGDRWQFGGYAGIALAAGAALIFLLNGGSYHPNALPTAAAVCVGLLIAGAERGFAAFAPPGPAAAASATSVAAIIALALAIFWVPFSLYPLSAVLGVIAIAFLWLRFGPWVPFTLLILGLLHFGLSLWMLLGSFEFAARSDGARPDPYFWPLMASCLVIVSLITITAAIQLRRRATALAT